MKLNCTKALMERLREVNFLDTYVVLAGKAGEWGMISSPNADGDTWFDIASMGKVLITSTLILRAESEGRLVLTDTLKKFFPQAPADKAQITVHDLLTHTSGIIRQPWMPDEVIAAGHSGIIDYIFAQPLAYPTGQDYRYSCYGYLLLGFILEQIYGVSLDVIYEKYIKEPLGLTRSRFAIPVDAENAAVTHYRPEIGDCACADDIVFRMKGVGGNGASFWTAFDLEKFTQAVLERSEKLYPERYFDLAERDYTPYFAEGRGLGYLVVDGRYAQTGDLFPAGSFGHCGNTGTSFFMDRKSGLYVILLTNATRFSYMRLNYRTCNYQETMDMRRDVHNTILQDLQEQGIL